MPRKLLPFGVISRPDGPVHAAAPLHRHTPAKKNQTGTDTPPVVPLRFLLGFVAVVTTTTRTFLKDSGVIGHDLQKLEDAWTKAVQLHVTLRSRPYAKDRVW